MSKPNYFEKFKCPTKKLQKSILLRGRTLGVNIPDYVDITRNRMVAKFKRKPFKIYDNQANTEMAARKNAASALDALRLASRNAAEISDKLYEVMSDLDQKKKEVLDTSSELESKCLLNIKKRELDRVDSINKIAEYLVDIRTLRTEKEKQDILIRIGLIMETLLYELGPYEELLGNLAFQDNAFKSKADTLGIRKNILLERRLKMISKLEEIIYETEEIKKTLFSRAFSLRKSTHTALNKVHKLMGKEIKTMRIVLDKESQISSIRNISMAVLRENAKFRWLIDWIITDVIGLEAMHDVTLSSGPLEKVQGIIESYKNLKLITANLSNNHDSQLVEKIFH